MKKILLTTSLCLLIVFSYAQNYSFEHYNTGTDTINVLENNRMLKHPFAGGMDVPQFAECDLNLDGKMDLVVFDREGYRLSTYINKGIANTISYEYAPEYIKKFPPITDWIQMADYDGDGKNDIFTSIPGGLRVYRNISDDINGLRFEDKFPSILCNYTSIITRLYIQNIDIPSIVDVDDDGDMDILTFYQSIDTSGESIYWYKNMSIERYGVKDSMDFVVGKYCWGRFRESYTDCRINLNYPVGICGNGGRFVPNISADEFLANLNQRISQSNSGGAHSGSTTLVYDANGDGKKDMLIGDVTCTNMYLVVNNNTNQDPIMTQTINHYPPNHPIVLDVFPAAFIADVNNDGLEDLIATTNTSNASQNTDHVQLFLNSGSTDIDRFNFSTDNFLLSEMIDVSEGSSPAFLDYNNDGLMDIVIANSGYWVNASSNKTGLALYKNIGSSTLAKYELVSRDWLGFSSLNIANMAPSFGDMDNDGDLDMVCGSNDGTLHYFRNTASAGNPMTLQYIPDYFGGIDVGNFSTPFIYDFNNDGKKEIIVGERYDNVNLIENTGTVSSPVYSIATDSLYKINLKNFSTYPSGRAHLQIQRLRPNEAPRVILSNGNGKIYIMDEVSTNYAQKMVKAVDSLALYAGQFSFANGGFCFSMADLNGDNKPELVVGNPQGGLFMYRNTSLSVGINASQKEKNIHIYPNPSERIFYVQSSNREALKSVKLMDINGRLLQEYSNIHTSVQIDASEYANGFYLIVIQTANEVLTEKVILQK